MATIREMINNRTKLTDIQGRRTSSTAFVLSGGGSLGAVQVGMLKALLEHDILPDVMVGSSAGALNAAVIAAYPSDSSVSRLEDIWFGMREEHIFPGGTLSQAWRLARRRNHLVTDKGVIDLIMRSLPVARFDELRIPIRIVATEVKTGEEHVFASGPLVRPLLASSAVPGVFPPVRIGEHVYIDGGVINNVPISHVAEADRVFVLMTRSSYAEPNLPKTPMGLMLRSFSIALGNRLKQDLAHYGQTTEIIVMPIPPIPHLRFGDLSHTQNFIDSAYDISTQFLDERAKADKGVKKPTAISSLLGRLSPTPTPATDASIMTVA